MRAEIEAIAREAGALALDFFRTRDTLDIEAKGPLDLVSRADRELEAMIAGRLRRVFPDDGILGEEGGHAPSRSGRTWVLDPIDGTFNFVRGGPEWGVSIGCHDAAGPLFGAVNLPVAGQLLSGGRDDVAWLDGVPLPALASFDRRRGAASVGLVPEAPLDATLAALGFVLGETGLALRICGSCVAGLMEVARGETDAYLGLAEHSWDVMAALPIVTALGGASTLDWRRIRLTDTLRFAAGKPDAVTLLRPLVA